MIALHVNYIHSSTNERHAGLVLGGGSAEIQNQFVFQFLKMTPELSLILKRDCEVRW